MKHLLQIILLFIGTSGYSQFMHLQQLFELPNKLEETSGLIYFDGHIITHNDSGDDAILYDIDNLTGEIIREVEIVNADNNDWEDIAQDDNYIYIGDFGNNDGDRTDLTIYRITKTTFNNNDEVFASIITYTYEDQVNFDSNHHDTNFDAEAMVVLDDGIYIFTKNWKNNRTNLYYLPNTINNHTATKVSTYNSQGLITGATYNKLDNIIYLCGYTQFFTPFVILLSDFSSNNIFDGKVVRTDITSTIGFGSQTEGIAFMKKKRYILSRETFDKEINGNEIYQPASLFEFEHSLTTNVSDNHINSMTIYPNPSRDLLKINIGGTFREFDNYQIIDSNGKVVDHTLLVAKNTIDISQLKTGVYYIFIGFSIMKFSKL